MARVSEGGSFGKASPYLADAKLLSSPRSLGRRSVSRSPWACRAGVATQEPRSQVRPAPHPVAASLPLGGAWEGSRCRAYAPRASREPACRLTCNTLCRQIGGWLESRQGASSPTPEAPVRCPESRDPCQGGGFRICGSAKRARILHRSVVLRHVAESAYCRQA